MSTKMFVNLFVADLQKSMALFTSIGFTFNTDFSDDSGACMVISEQNYAMLLTEAKIREIIPPAFTDSAMASKSIIALSCDTREDVARLVNQAIAAGGKRYEDPQDHGFMIQDGFLDLDGHAWSFFWMDNNRSQQAEKS